MSLSRILNKPKGKAVYCPDPRWVLPEQLIGFEAEYEGVKNNVLPNHTFANHFTYHFEQSIAGGGTGAEYVFTQPLFGTDAYNAITWLVEYAKEQDWKCTKRTGIHIHLDVRDLEVPQLIGLCMLYAALEPILYKWIGTHRETSHFCVPLYKADNALLSFCKIINSALRDIKNGTNSALAICAALEEQRYSGLNPHSLAKFGSLEFRHLETTHDLNRIISWINMIMSLKSAAYRLPRSDGMVVQMMQQMGALELLNYVFPLTLANQLYTNDAQLVFSELGLPSARDIAVHGCQPLNWDKFEMPKGENEGFSRWLKAQNPVPKPKIPLDDYDDFLDEDGPAVEAVQAAAPQPVDAGNMFGVGAPPPLDNNVQARIQRIQRQFVEAAALAPRRRPHNR